LDAHPSSFAFSFSLFAFLPFLVPPEFLQKRAKTPDIPPRSSKQKKFQRGDYVKETEQQNRDRKGAFNEVINSTFSDATR
jgi:hypothetical protein